MLLFPCTKVSYKDQWPDSLNMPELLENTDPDASTKFMLLDCESLSQQMVFALGHSIISNEMARILSSFELTLDSTTCFGGEAKHFTTAVFGVMHPTVDYKPLHHFITFQHSQKQFHKFYNVFIHFFLR